MSILFIAGVVLLALWLVEAIVFLVAYRRSNRADSGLPDAHSSWRSGRPKDGGFVTSPADRQGSTQTAMLS